MPSQDYRTGDPVEPHVGRARQMLALHPELRQLAGPAPSSAIWVALLVAVQIAIALTLRDAPWWVLLIAAYVVGAFANHALFVLIHDCSHNLVFYRKPANRLVAIVANIPLAAPAAIAFANYHMLHHRHMGEMSVDADLPGPVEARMVGRSPVAKAAWLFLFPLVEGVVRPLRLRTVRVIDRWVVLNVVVQIMCMTLLVMSAGWAPFVYLFASTFFGVGLHPLGGRWIQEHFVFREGQETYSYYGPLNTVAFNVGYHNEHHDLVTVPWSRLPRVRAIAPEFYDGLYAHSSWTRLLLTFLFDRHLGLHDRIVRDGRTAPAHSAPEALTPAGVPADGSPAPIH